MTALVERERATTLPGDWEELANRSAATPFAHPEWVRAWHEAFAAGRALEPLGVRRDGRLIAIFPFLRSAGALRAPTNWHTPQFELLAEDGGARAELCERVLVDRPRELSARFLPAAQAATLAAAAARAGYVVLRRPLTQSPLIDIHGRSWEEHERGLRSDHRGDVRRRWRRLREQGHVAVETHDGSERLEELLRDGFAVEASGWKGKAGTAILSRPETAGFYTRVARWAAARGWLRLSFIRLDGHAIAFAFDLVYRNVDHNLKIAYDEAFKRYSPGKLLTAALVERAFANGLERYEFNGAPEPYKLAWATGTDERESVQAFAPTPLGLGTWLAYAVGRPLAKRVLARGARG